MHVLWVRVYQLQRVFIHALLLEWQGGAILLLAIASCMCVQACAQQGFVTFVLVWLCQCLTRVCCMVVLAVGCQWRCWLLVADGAGSMVMVVSVLSGGCLLLVLLVVS